MAVAALVILSSCGDDDRSTETSDASGTSAATVAGEAPLAGVVRDPQPNVADLTLPEVVDAEAETIEDFTIAAPGPEDLLLMYFGYTSCPDVCPTTMADVRTALEDLGPDAERVSVAMATVDPERDTGEVLDGYLRFFVPERSHVLRTEDFDQLHEVEDAFGASSRLVPHEDGNGYDVEHTGTLYVVDGSGDLVLEWPFGSVSADQMTADLQRLLDQEAST